MIMASNDERQYRTTHPWITFGFDAGRLSPRTWVLLGEAASKCEHLAGSAMPPRLAERLNQVSLERGVRATTAIEGNTLTEEEVHAIVTREAAIPPSQAYQGREIENLLGLFEDITSECLAPQGPPPLSPERLQAQHARLMAGQPADDDVTPGEFRTHSVVVGRYLGAPAADCPYLVGRLCDWLGEEMQALAASDAVLRLPRALVLAIVAHLHLTWIHPFGDGNGRMSRLLEHELMLRAGLPVPAAHLLSDHYNRTRDRYYASLEATSRARPYPVEDFVHYAAEGLVDGLRRQVQEVQGWQLHIMWESYVHEQFKGKHTPAQVRMRDVALALPPGSWTQTDDVTMLSRPINRAYAGKTSKTITRDLDALERMGLVERRRGTGVRPRVEVMAAFLPPRRGQ